MNILIFILLIFSILVDSFASGGNILKRNSGGDRKPIKIEPQEDTPSEEILFNKQFFQDIFSNHFAPMKIEFGHVYENPEVWEQRFERNDMKNKRFQGKVLWGSKDGEYGEHYWDLNHR